MDASGLVSGLVLATSLLTFTYISLRQSLPHPRSNLPAELQTLALLRLASTIAVAISALALFFSLSWMTWPLATAFAFALLSLLIALRWMSGYLALNHPRTVLFVTSPLHRLSSFALMKSGSTKLGGDIAFGMTNGGVNGDGYIPQGVEAVMISEEHETLDERERSMIRSILRLDEYNARDIMVPRVDIVAADLEDGLADVANRMLESGHSRLPVYRETIDNVTGIIHSRDLLPLLNMKAPWPSLEKLLREPFFVPETKRLDELLSEFQKLRVQMALVVDEHGGIEGLVTLEDLLEEIVGEIEDEFSTTEEPQIAPTDDGKLIVDARISLNDLEEFVPLKFDQADVDTIGGLVYSTLGKMPQAGDEVVYDGLRIKVLSTVGRRLRKLQLTPELGEKTDD